jgi:transcriptional regulator with XRE-family HTH domain
VNNTKRIADLEGELKLLKKQGRTKRDPVAGIGGIVQMQREARLIGLQELANAASLSPGLVSNIEQGKLTNPTWNTIKALAKALKIKPSQLVAGFEVGEDEV